MATPRTTETFNRYKNAKVKFIQVDKWLDGSDLSDKKNADKFDDILYKRKVISGKAYYYRRQFEPDTKQAALTQSHGHAFNLADYDFNPENDPETNSERIDYLLNYFPNGYALNLYLEQGRHEIARPITFNNPVNLAGVYGGAKGPGSKTGSRIAQMGNVTAIYTNHPGAEGSTFLDIAVDGTGAMPEWCSGFNSRTVASFYRCSAGRFSHNGFDIWANMESEGTNASNSLLERCEAYECGGGFFAGRMDANVINFKSCSASNNKKWGFESDSFLGNTFDACMAHYNGMDAAPQQGGDYTIKQWENARDVFTGCYSEGGNPNYSQFGFKTTVIGGMWGTGFRIMNETDEKGNPLLRYKTFIPVM